MSDGGSWVEILLLAMLAGFIGLRLVSVLGKRTGHERPAGDSFRASNPEVTPALARGAEAARRTDVTLPAGTDAGLAPALQALADADPGFDPARFLTGAQAAYRMVLESFWAGETEALAPLMADEVHEHFAEAIAARDGARLDNRLASIDGAAIKAAQIVGQMAEVTVKFAARVSSGSADAVATGDVWTFSRHLGSRDPNWLLITTDADD